MPADGCRPRLGVCQLGAARIAVLGQRRSLMPRAGSSLIVGCGAGTPSVVHAARVHGAPGAEADRGSRRGRRAGTPTGTPRCRRRPWPASRSGPGPGCRLPAGGPGSSSGPDPSGGQAPGMSRHGRPTAVQLAGTVAAGAPASCPGITLSDTGGQGECPHCRRSACQAAWSPWSSASSRKIVMSGW
jgi:hypothetical protein